MDYVEQWAVTCLGIQDKSTLEVGSYDVNGSVRNLFTGSYIGVDMAQGPGVNIQALASSLPFSNGSFHTVISTEMLEHDTKPWLSVCEMGRVTSRYVILTARGYDERGCYPLHDYPRDYWRYSTGAIKELCEWAGLSMLHLINDGSGGPGVFAVARKD